MTEEISAVDVDYATRDYEGFRQLLLSLLDRSSTRWTERAAADVGVALVEILSHELDLLSYAADRVAQEGSLSGARVREYARRHAALSGYRLDRGNLSRGFQYFRALENRALTVPRGTRVTLQSAEIAAVVFETTEPLNVDARRNELRLLRAAARGETWLRLAPKLDGDQTLQEIGLAPQTRLCIRKLESQSGEIVQIRRVTGHAVELTAPLQATYTPRSTEVFGNIVPILSGTKGGWEKVAIAGAALAELAPADFIRARILWLHGLREQVEAARAHWATEPGYVAFWELAHAEVSLVARALRHGLVTAVPQPTDRAQPSERSALPVNLADERLRRAGDLYRELLRGAGFSVPVTFLDSDRVPLQRERVRIDDAARTTWDDSEATLEVSVGAAGRFQRFSEVDDFLASGPNDLHYVVETGASDALTLCFGDGVHGALLPPGAEIMVRRITGLDRDADIAADTLNEVELPETLRDLLHPSTPTTNPLPTSGARSPGVLGDELARTVRRELSRRALPVTTEDYAPFVMDHLGAEVAEVSVAIESLQSPLGARGNAALGLPRVNVTVRPRTRRTASSVYERARDLLRRARLAGTDVWLRPAEPLYVSIELILELHPELSRSDVYQRVRDRLLSLLGENDDPVLGKERTPAEIYAAVEKVPGVRWSQLIGFGPASAAVLAAVAPVTPKAHQFVRCLDLPESPLAGAIRLWSAQRIRLQLELGFPDPDLTTDSVTLSSAITTLLSGPYGAVAAQGLREIDAGTIEGIIEAARASSDTTLPRLDPKCRLRVLKLVYRGAAVSNILLAESDCVIVDSCALSKKPFYPHFGLIVRLANTPVEDAEALKAQMRERLSGPGGIPAADGWSELSRALVERALSNLAGVSHVEEITIRGQPVERFPLPPDAVPVLDAGAVVLLDVDGRSL